MAIKYSCLSYGHDVNHINLIFVIQSCITSVLHVVLILCYWEDLISEDKCERVYLMAEWKGEMLELKKPPDVQRDIGDVLNGTWNEYIFRQLDTVILLLTHVLFAYSIHCVSKCECMQCRNVYLCCTGILRVAGRCCHSYQHSLPVSDLVLFVHPMCVHST